VREPNIMREGVERVREGGRERVMKKKESW
jgi:hypothetical protein